jgi:very-short-patch-repair endonuclease
MPTRGPTPEWLQAVGLAETQFGVVSAGQLLALGASRDWIKERLRRRQLRPLHRDVYAVGHAVLVPQGRWLAAALAVPGAVLSHRTAAAIWRLDVTEPATPELTSAREARSRPGLILHRSRTLVEEDIVRWHGVSVTRIERTLVDLGDVSSADEVMRVTDGLKSIDRDRLAATLDRAGPRKAHSVLRPVLDDGPRTRSELERAFVRMARRFGLGSPRCNVWVAGLLVDAYWPDHRLVVECDSRRWHASWAARRNDHARDARLQLAGFATLRVTWVEVRHRPELGAARIRPFLWQGGRAKPDPD